jgi:hypothetical protein
MIYITGDCHREFTKLTTGKFPQQKQMTKDDFVIICGDFGGVWDRDKESREERYILDWLEGKPFTTLFVDGNHENFDRLYAYLVEEWHGGKVHKIRPSVIHLMRGQVFNIDGKSIFTFGGAKSHDYSKILEMDDPNFHQKRHQLDHENLSYRVNHLSWWEQEMPSEEEMQEGIRNLEKAGNEVDFIITHCCASSTQALFGFGTYTTDELTNYFENIKLNVKFKKWFFGHYHDDRNVAENEILLYDAVTQFA